jgi:hypothetical protein
MQNQLSKAISLVKKTGDKIIIFEGINCDIAYTVMKFDDYEKLILGRSEVRGLTENELFDKINRDIAVWKSQQNDISEIDNYPPKNYGLDRSSHQKTREELNNFSADDWEFEREGYIEDSADLDEGDDEENLPEEDLYYYENKDEDILKSEFLNSGKDEQEENIAKRKSIWQIPREVKESAEEVVENKF